MPSIMDILAERARRRGQQQVTQQGVISAIVIRRTGPRYLVNDGSQAVTCDTMVPEALKEGDRVWVAQGRGVSVILGLHGRDKDFA